MIDKYIPDIHEASVPEEASWIKIETGWALVLSIPEWKEIVGCSAEGYRYVWMYDRMEKAYLFCFRLGGQLEKAIAFPHDHAGMLLQDDRAQGKFSIIITAEGLTEHQASLLQLKGVRLRRHPQAEK